MPSSNHKSKIPDKTGFSFYHYGLIVVLLALAIFIWREGTNLFLNYSDYSYHLAVAQGFIRAKGIVFWDFWESLPKGRPHNYPPLLHIILASLIQSGLSVGTATKILLEIVLAGGLSVYAWGITKIFNIKTAFFAVLILFFSYNFITISATTLPATIAFFTAPLILHLTLSKKWLALWAIIVLVLYTHLFIPYFIAFALFIYLAITDRKLILPALKISLLAYLAYLPWLLHVLIAGYKFIKYFDSNYNPANNINGVTFINLIIIFLFISSLFYVLKYHKNEIIKPNIYFIILSLILIPATIISPGRIISGPFLVAASVPSATLLIFLIQKRSFYQYVAYALIIYYALQTPYFLINNAESNHLYFDKSTIQKIGLMGQQKEKLEDRFSGMFQAIKKNSSKGDLITSAVSWFNNTTVEPLYQIHVANFFASNTARSTLNMRQPEFYHRRQPNIAEADIIILNFPPSAFKSNNCERLRVLEYDLPCSIGKNFQLISSYISGNGNNVYAYLNKDHLKFNSEKIPSHSFPIYLADLIILGLLFALLYNYKNQPRA